MGKHKAKRRGTVKIVSEEQLARSLAQKEGREGINEDNRRRDPRLAAEFQVEVPLSWEQLKQAYTMNISKGGLTFSIEPPASIPSALELTLVLPDGHNITLTSEVRHVAPRSGDSAGYEVGVQFKKLDGKTQQTLDAALTQISA